MKPFREAPFLLKSLRLRRQLPIQQAKLEFLALRRVNL